MYLQIFTNVIKKMQLKKKIRFIYCNMHSVYISETPNFPRTQKIRVPTIIPRYSSFHSE